MKIKKQACSIYIHIPFCVKKCLYCDFLSAPMDVRVQENYVKALIREIQRYGRKDFVKQYECRTIFFGGGTPSLLKVEWIEEILDALKQNFCFSAEVEITLECNPKTAGEEKLAGFLKAGINRLSIGLQSANNEELKRLGRVHSYEEFCATYAAARKAGFRNINVDVMAALPGQTIASFEDTLEKVLALQPEHISAYQLIIEEGTPFYDLYGDEILKKTKLPDNWVPLPDEDTEREMYERTEILLKEQGYERYEISNYSKKGFACRHNLSYWTGVDYIGFGIGAASYVKGVRYSCIRDLHRYLQLLLEYPETAAETDVCRELYENRTELSEKNKMEEFMFLGLRLIKGVSKEEFQTVFGCPMEAVYAEPLQKMEQLGLLVNEKGQQENGSRDARVYLTKRGLDLANRVMAEFLIDEDEKKIV